MNSHAARPLLVVLSGPSGAGKTSLCERLLTDREDLVYSVSCTTRPPRGNEIHGKDYFFLCEGDFAEHVEQKRFLEHATVHDHKYGTLNSTVRKALESGRSVLMDIDVDGARQVRRHVSTASDDDAIKNSLVAIFVTAPSLEIFRERLLKRREDSVESIERRMTNAELEMASVSEYPYVIVNDDLDSAYSRLRKIVEKEGRIDHGK